MLRFRARETGDGAREPKWRHPRHPPTAPLHASVQDAGDGRRGARTQVAPSAPPTHHGAPCFGSGRGRPGDGARERHPTRTNNQRGATHPTSARTACPPARTARPLPVQPPPLLVQPAPCPPPSAPIPFLDSLSSSSNRPGRCTTTPLPITFWAFGCRRPLGTRWKSNFWSPTTIVCPALFPPWDAHAPPPPMRAQKSQRCVRTREGVRGKAEGGRHTQTREGAAQRERRASCDPRERQRDAAARTAQRATMSASAARTSTSLPFPSSPHCAPITTVTPGPSPAILRAAVCAQAALGR